MEYQKARLDYQFNKVSALRKGMYPAFGGNIEFELFSFFEVCYHLKDWVKESTGDATVESFVNETPAIRIAADICNRLKHKNLHKGNNGEVVTHKRSKAPLGPFEISSTTTIGAIPELASVSIRKALIHTERGKECCFELAIECMDDWRSFSQNRGQTNDSLCSRHSNTKLAEVCKPSNQKLHCTTS